jgi:alkaline phosphatase D
MDRRVEPTSGRKRRVLLALLTAGATCLAVPPRGIAQAEALQSGPMVGYATMREVLLWVQTNRPAEVGFVYWEMDKPEHRYRTERARTTKALAYAAKLTADSVQPGRRYGYELYIDGHLVERPHPLRFQTPVLWQWRTHPPDFRLAVGSCNYVNDPRTTGRAPRTEATTRSSITSSSSSPT